jgi:hypothetical protein
MSNFSNAFLPEIDNSARFMRNKTTTENGMVTNISSGSNLVDLFFKMGASRKVSEQELENIFEKSYNENPPCSITGISGVGKVNEEVSGFSSNGYVAIILKSL